MIVDVDSSFTIDLQNVTLQHVIGVVTESKTWRRLIAGTVTLARGV